MSAKHSSFHITFTDVSDQYSVFYKDGPPCTAVSYCDELLLVNAENQNRSQFFVNDNTMAHFWWIGGEDGCTLQCIHLRHL